MSTSPVVTPSQRSRALWLSTVAFGVCFAVWVIYSIIGVELKQELGFSDSAFGLLVATPILTGSLSRLPLGIWSEMYGGRLVYTLLMLVVAACVFTLPFVSSYPMLLLVGLGLGLAGGSCTLQSLRTAGASGDEMIHTLWYLPLEANASVVAA